MKPLAKWKTLTESAKTTMIQSASTCKSTIYIFGLNCTEPTTYLVLSFHKQRRVDGNSICVPVPTKKKMLLFLYESHRAVPPGMLDFILVMQLKVSHT